MSEGHGIIGDVPDDFGIGPIAFIINKHYPASSLPVGNRMGSFMKSRCPDPVGRIIPQDFPDLFFLIHKDRFQKA